MAPARVAEHAFSLYVGGLVAWLNGAFATPGRVLAHVAFQIEVLVRGVALARARADRKPKQRGRRDR
jgi:hypothetical protein